MEAFFSSVKSFTPASCSTGDSDGSDPDFSYASVSFRVSILLASTSGWLNALIPITDPATAAKQTVHMVLHGEVVSRTGKAVNHPVDTLCLHGDEPSAIAVGQACRQALEEAGVKIVTLPEMNLN